MFDQDSSAHSEPVTKELIMVVPKSLPDVPDTAGDPNDDHDFGMNHKMVLFGAIAIMNAKREASNYRVVRTTPRASRHESAPRTSSSSGLPLPRVTKYVERWPSL